MNKKFKKLLEENPYLFYNVYCQGELYERTELPHHNCEYCGWNGSRGGATLDILLKELIKSAIEDMLWESIHCMDNPYSIEAKESRYVADDDITTTINNIIVDIISKEVELDVDINIEDDIYYLHNEDIDIDVVRNILESMIE